METRVLGRVAIALTIASATWLAARARAGNDDGVLIGAEATMTGGAVAATVRDGTALWHNPAGFAAAERDQVDVSASAFQARFVLARGLLTTTRGQTAGDETLDFFSIPSAVTYVRRIEPNLRLAFGIFSPATFETSLKTQLSASDAMTGGTAAWNVASNESNQRYHASVGLATNVTPRLAIGGTIGGIYTQLSGARHFWAGRTTPMMPEAFYAESSLQALKSFGLDASIGLQWQPVDELSIGIAARTPAMQVATFDRTTSAQGYALPTGTNFSGIDANPGIQTSVGVLLPARLRVAVAYRFNGGYASIDGEIAHPLRDASFAIDRHWLVNVRAGAKFDVSDTVSVGGGIFTDLNADAISTLVSRQRADYIGLAAGVEFSDTRRLAETERADSLDFRTLIGVRYAYGWGGSLGQLVSDTGDLMPARRDVPVSVHELSLQLGSSFMF